MIPVVHGCNLIKRLLLVLIFGGPASAQFIIAGHPQPNQAGTYDVFYGPFNSWLNVKNPSALGLRIPAAKGDGVTDDTAAIQAALDSRATQSFGFISPTSSTQDRCRLCTSGHL
jgi:hypothetical protein